MLKNKRKEKRKEKKISITFRKWFVTIFTVGKKFSQLGLPGRTSGPQLLPLTPCPPHPLSSPGILFPHMPLGDLSQLLSQKLVYGRTLAQKFSQPDSSSKLVRVYSQYFWHQICGVVQTNSQFLPSCTCPLALVTQHKGPGQNNECSWTSLSEPWAKEASIVCQLSRLSFYYPNREAHQVEHRRRWESPGPPHGKALPCVPPHMGSRASEPLHLGYFLVWGVSLCRRENLKSSRKLQTI